MEKIVNHDDARLFLMKMVFFVMVVSFSAMLVAAVNGGFPDSFKYELALGKCDFSANHRIVLLELPYDLVLLIGRQFS